MVKKTAKKKPGVTPSEKEIRTLAKAALGENAHLDVYPDGRLYLYNEQDISLELESTSNAEARRLARPILEAIGKYRRNAKTGRKP